MKIPSGFQPAAQPRRRSPPPLLGLVLAVFAALLPAGRVWAVEEEWSVMAVLRLGNIDQLDAEDGALARFVKGIRNDGRFIQPVRTLAGPEIRNPTFFGLTYEAWLECVVMTPLQPGQVEPVWTFPVDSRDEYMSQLASLGFAEYEGMDGVTTLREIDPDGVARVWSMEWLPGNVAVFGSRREAVKRVREVYAEQSAARGLLHGATGKFGDPDVCVRFFPKRMAGWQKRDAGVYWWRDKVEKLAKDLVSYWQPSLARTRLINQLAEETALLPLGYGQIDANVWFEENEVEWRLEVEGRWQVADTGEVASLRSMPERTALAYAVPLSSNRVRLAGESLGRFLLGAAGGGVTREARLAGETLWEALLEAEPKEAAAGWILPPAGRPELGVSRVLVTEWENPDALMVAWREALLAFGPGTPLTQVLSQMGLETLVVPAIVGPGSVTLAIYPMGGMAKGEPPYFNALYCLGQMGGRLVLVGGDRPADDESMRRVAAYRQDLAREMAAAKGPGSPEMQNAFSRMNPAGASIMGILCPVRFLQLALIESADWRPRSPDQHEPLTTRFAREMLEYGPARAWAFAGEGTLTRWRLSGSLTWQSLARLSAALGITESIGMEGAEETHAP